MAEPLSIPETLDQVVAQFLREVDETDDHEARRIEMAEPDEVGEPAQRPRRLQTRGKARIERRLRRR